ncbi:MAG: adenosylcobinamide-GDP ribazoletransferase [Propionibacteriaceae bacterium]|nr:adenosylcobinamide-GDP ribazoletransferase [Propionibacteriaceae bacterium]
MTHEIRLLLTAVMFYTRLPVPKWVGYSPEQLNASTRYFPAIGWIVGTVVGGVAWGAQLLLPAPVAVVLALIVGVMLTGAFHEDGFADLCDGFGGGTTKERTLEIMKDSRVGAYAVIGLVLLFALKVSVLVAFLDGWAGRWLPSVTGGDVWFVIPTVIFAHVASRWAVTWIILRYEYARDDLTSKSKPIGRSMSGGGFVYGTLYLLGALALVVLLPNAAPRLLRLAISSGAVLLAWLVALRCGAWFRTRLGGYTGDCLGAAQQIIEQVILIAILISAHLLLPLE